MPNPGTPAFGLPPADDDFVRLQADLGRQQRENAAARTLEAAEIGSGGLTVTGGFLDLKSGSTLHVSGDAVFDGTLTLPAGSLDTPGGSISAGVDMSAGQDVNATRDVAAGRDVSADRNLIVGGDASIDGTVGVGGNVGVTGQVAVNGPVFFPDAYNTLITGPRLGAWWGSDGRGGYQPSTRDAKTNERPAVLDSDAILGLQLHYFQYRAEIAKHEADPAYEVATELGLFAEDLDAAGLTQFVFYGGDEGEKRPLGIHYENLSLAVLAVAQGLDSRLQAMERRLTDAGV